MMETLSRGLGEVLYAEGKNVLIYLPEIGNAMLNAEDEEHLEKMLPLIPKAVSEHSIVTVTDRWNDVYKRQIQHCQKSRNNINGSPRNR